MEQCRICKNGACEIVISDENHYFCRCDYCGIRTDILENLDDAVKDWQDSMKGIVNLG